MKVIFLEFLSFLVRPFDIKHWAHNETKLATENKRISKSLSKIEQTTKGRQPTGDTNESTKWILENRPLAQSSDCTMLTVLVRWWNGLWSKVEIQWNFVNQFVNLRIAITKTQIPSFANGRHQKYRISFVQCWKKLRHLMHRL